MRRTRDAIGRDAATLRYAWWGGEKSERLAERANAKGEITGGWVGGWLGGTEAETTRQF